MVSVFEAGEFEDIAFYMMEFCYGGSAADHGKMPIGTAAAVILQVLDALIFMSRVTAFELVDDEPQPFTGLVHRDLKPANILFPTARSCRAKVADFGFAKAYEAAGLTNVTREPPYAAGTAPYMPRQQVVEFRAAKPEVDVWAAAASFYQMLTGKVPRNFGPNRNKHFNDIMETAPILIRQRDPTVPELIALLIDRALDDTMTKPGGLAFQSASEFRDAFITALEQSSITVAVP